MMYILTAISCSVFIILCFICIYVMLGCIDSNAKRRAQYPEDVPCWVNRSGVMLVLSLFTNVVSLGWQFWIAVKLLDTFTT